MLREEIVLIVESLLKKDKKKKIHVSCSNSRFYNGVVLNCDEYMLNLNDNILGPYSIPYSLIINVELMRDRK